MVFWPMARIRLVSSSTGKIEERRKTLFHKCGPVSSGCVQPLLYVVSMFHFPQFIM